MALCFCVSGYCSWRNNKDGSIFIRKLCAEFQEKDAHSTELVTLLTRVNYEISAHFTSLSPNNMAITGMKQSPQIVSMLRKPLYLKPQ